MKIIGETIDNCQRSYIVQIGVSELEKLTNYYHSKLPTLKSGDTIDIAALYDQLQYLKTGNREIEKLKETLRMIQRATERVNPIALVPFEKVE